MTLQVQHHTSAGLTFNFNYSWSHALDDVSNGGIPGEPFSYGSPLTTDGSLVFPQNPFNIRGNYGNADQDVRHNITLNWDMSDLVRHAGFHGGPNRLFGGWTLAGDLFYRTGLPFTVIDSASSTTLNGFNYGGAPVTPVLESVFATPITNQFASCNSNAVNAPCLTTSEFAPSTSSPTGFGIQGRNDFRGPGFFNMDLSLMKDVTVREPLRISFGVQVYNLLNHPNFDQPVNDIANPQFGTINKLVGPPTSILGSFVGGGNSPRFIEVKGVFRF